MFKFSRRRSPFILSLIMAAVTIFGTFAAFASHSWGGYHWARTSNPFTIKVGNNVTSDWNSAFNTAVTDWNSSSVMNLAPLAGTSNKHCSMVSGTIQVCNGRYGNNGWLGLASINLTGGTHITQGSAKMNDTYFSTATYNNPNERLHVMCQEVGHTFGLDHQSTDGSSQNSCMDYFSNTGANAGSTQSTHPNQHDYDELAIIYQHLDSSTTIAASKATAPTSASEDTEDPNNWGRLTSQSANGRSSTYERGNPDGSKTATHVIWTEEAAARCPGCDHRYDH